MKRDLAKYVYKSKKYRRKTLKQIFYKETNKILTENFILIFLFLYIFLRKLKMNYKIVNHLNVFNPLSTFNLNYNSILICNSYLFCSKPIHKLKIYRYTHYLKKLTNIHKVSTFFRKDLISVSNFKNPLSLTFLIQKDKKNFFFYKPQRLIARQIYLEKYVFNNLNYVLPHLTNFPISFSLLSKKKIYSSLHQILYSKQNLSSYEFLKKRYFEKLSFLLNKNITKFSTHFNVNIFIENKLILLKKKFFSKNFDFENKDLLNFCFFDYQKLFLNKITSLNLNEIRHKFNKINLSVFQYNIFFKYFFFEQIYKMNVKKLNAEK